MALDFVARQRGFEHVYAGTMFGRHPTHNISPDSWGDQSYDVVSSLNLIDESPMAQP